MLNGPAVVALAAATLEQQYGVAGFVPARLTVDLFKGRTEAADDDPHPADPRRTPGAQRQSARCGRASHGRPRDPGAVPDLQAPPGRNGQGRQRSPAAARPTATRSTSVATTRAGVPPGRTTRTPPASASTTAPSTRWPVSTPPLSSRAVIVAVRPPAWSAISAPRASATSTATSPLRLSRLPIGEFVGVQGDSHWCADGISVGSATLFDDRGPFGTGLVTAIANPAAQIDFGSADAMPTLRGVTMTPRSGCADYGRGT